MKRIPASSTQSGAALPVGLILLMVLTLLGVAAMNSSRMQLLMTGSAQDYEYAHQAAEAGLHVALANETPAIDMDTGEVAFTLPGNANDTATGTYRMRYLSAGPVPSGGWTVGSVTARHFVVDSTASTSSSNQSETHRQGLFLIAPAN